MTREKYADLDQGLARLSTIDPDATGTVTIPLEVGALLRRQVRGALKQAKLYFDLESFEWEESKGLLDSSFLIKASGNVGELRRLTATVAGWVRE